MSVEDAPQEGFVRDNKFMHPLLNLGFEAPHDFRLFNDQDGVLGVGREPLVAVLRLHRANRCLAASPNGCATG